jgi:hypothetical protein
MKRRWPVFLKLARSGGGMVKTNSSAIRIPMPPGMSNASAASAAPAVGGEDIHDIKQPLPLGGGLWWVWALVAAVVIAALAIWLKKRKKVAALPPALYIPPHRRAKERLRGASELISDPYRFCSLVSDVTRDYLEERFNLHAPDRTTDEFLAELRESSVLKEEHKALLEDFLTRCDLVKFARHEPTEPELRALLDAALRLIDETQEVEAKPALEAAAK